MNNFCNKKDLNNYVMLNDLYIYGSNLEENRFYVQDVSWDKQVFTIKSEPYEELTSI